MKVILSELALAGFYKCELDEEKRRSIELSMKLHLRQEQAIEKSIKLLAPIDAELFLFPLWKFRIVWQHQPELRTIWSISLLRTYQT